MRKTFIESPDFTRRVRDHLPDDALAALQHELMADPDKGKVISGCGGLRKLRVADPGRGEGKRGGARIIYLHLEASDEIHLIAVYGKNQKADLSAQDKKMFRELVQLLKVLSHRSQRRKPS